jgi:acetyl esterase/lipase
MKKKIILTSMVIILLSSCVQSVSSLPNASTSMIVSSSMSSTVVVTSETEDFLFNSQVPYGLDPRQSLEIAYRPNDESPTPLILFIHGGSWISGDKSMMRRYQDQVVDAGYAYVSMNYRFVTIGLTYSGFTYLDMLDDIQLTLQLLKTNADLLNLDTSRMAIVGESAGAHLAMLYAYRNVSPIPIEFAMALVPPVDFTDPGYLSFGDPTFQLFLANGLMATSLMGPEDLVANGYPDAWMDASPIHHLSTAIPTLIGYAGLDELIPLSNMEGFLIAATAIDAPIEAILFPNSGHSLSSDPDKLSELLATFFMYLNNFLPLMSQP